MLVLSQKFCAAVETNTTPKKFSAYIGGFLGTSYTVELQNGVLNYSEAKSPKDIKTNQISPTPEQWLNFRHELDNIKIWSWKTNYPNSKVYDGTQWSIDIEYPDHVLHVRGNNNYPEKSGKPNNKPEPTKVFKDYLAAIQNLLGGKKFD